MEQSERILVGDFHRSRTSLFYLMGLFTVAVAMILLPLIYVGIVAGIAYAVYCRATHNLTIVSSGTAGIYGRLWVYVAPIVAGITLVLFMLKPLVLGMTLPQLTGVLAHEFGHSTQAIGMRLTFLIRRASKEDQLT